MKAWVLHEAGELHLEEINKPEPADNEVLVEVKAAGICGSDIPRIYKAAGAHVYPLIPGHEFSGRVVQTGKSVDRRWQNKRVSVFPLIPCNHCSACQKHQYELCCNYSYLGSRRNGGFAEYVAAPAWNLVELPDNVSYRQAAMMEPMAVAVHAMRNAVMGNDDKSKTIAVCGLGSVGSLLTMFLKEAGYTEIYAIGNKNIQRETAIRIGIDERHILNEVNSAVDVFFECVGKNETVASAVMGTAQNGTIQLVGNPDSDILLEKDIYWKIVRNQLTVKGTWNSSFQHGSDDDWNYVLDRLHSGKINPDQYITHCFSLDELEKGLMLMRDKTQEYIKVMIS